MNWWQWTFAVTGAWMWLAIAAATLWAIIRAHYRPPAPGTGQDPPPGPAGNAVAHPRPPLVPGPRTIAGVVVYYDCPCYDIRAPDRRILHRKLCTGHADFARWEKELQR